MLPASPVLQRLFRRPARLVIALAMFGIVTAGTGCSINTLAMRKVAAALSGGGNVFAGDNDPELIEGALPFALKTYESILQGLPDDPALLLATGSAFTMYANVFVHLPADTLSDSRISVRKEQLARAKKLYMRARGYLLHALDVRYPGFAQAAQYGNIDSLLSRTSTADTALLYWTGASWMAAFTTDIFDMSLAAGMKRAVAMVNRVTQLDEQFGQGSAHEFFISYYGSMPASMGGSVQKARDHFSRAVEINGGTKAGPYIALASSVCVAAQDAVEYRELLAKALAIDPDANVQNRLANIIMQRKARWLLDNINNFFLLDDNDDGKDSQ